VALTRAELIAAGFDIGEAAYARLARFVDHLLDENTRLNLTGAKSAADVWNPHVCDSLALVPLVAEFDARSLLDLGAGGGFPGIPVACLCDDLAVTLLDATQKKTAALERIVAGVELPDVRVRCARAEALAHDPAHRERYDLVAARAVAELRVLLEYAAGFVRPGGYCCFFKTPAAIEREARGAARAAKACRLEPRQAHTYHLPREQTARAIAVYQKTVALPDNLPRAAGQARKHPL
jgi:16S rRNA (guanine527-N7)-methyltransferase